MFGYACTDTPELMPLPIALAHRLSRRMAYVRKVGEVPYLRPDGKTQVTIEYLGNRPIRLDTVVLSTQHADGIDHDQMLAVDLLDHVLKPELDALAAGGLTVELYEPSVFVNPTGRFVIAVRRVTPA